MPVIRDEQLSVCVCMSMYMCMCEREKDQTVLKFIYVLPKGRLLQRVSGPVLQQRRSLQQRRPLQGRLSQGPAPLSQGLCQGRVVGRVREGPRDSFSCDGYPRRSLQVQGIQEKLSSSKNFQNFTTSPSPALGCYWLYRKLPANTRLTMRTLKISICDNM